MSFIILPPSRPTGDKRKFEGDVKRVYVVASMRGVNDEEFVYEFDMENSSASLVEKHYCSHNFTFERLRDDNLHFSSNGFSCTGYGERVLPRMLASATTALVHLFPSTRSISYQGELQIDEITEEYDSDDSNYDEKLKDAVEQATWRVRYYDKLGFDVGPPDDYDDYDFGAMSFMEYEGDLIELRERWRRELGVVTSLKRS